MHAVKYLAVNDLDVPKMPPKQALFDAQIASLKPWAELGAPRPRFSRTLRATRDRHAKTPDFRPTKCQRTWWSFQLVRDPVPPVSNSAWPRNGMACFVAAEHAARGLCRWYGFSRRRAGGVRGGIVQGSADEYGWRAVHDTVRIHDLHATILRPLGVDHGHLICRHGGRGCWPGDVPGHVVRASVA